MSLAENVRKLRLEKGWSQTDLAQAIGSSYPRISEIENGKGNPTLKTLSLLAQALGTTADKLVRSRNGARKKMGRASKVVFTA